MLSVILIGCGIDKPHRCAWAPRPNSPESKSWCRPECQERWMCWSWTPAPLESNWPHSKHHRLTGSSSPLLAQSRSAPEFLSRNNHLHLIHENTHIRNIRGRTQGTNTNMKDIIFAIISLCVKSFEWLRTPEMCLKFLFLKFLFLLFLSIFLWINKVSMLCS